MLLRTAFAGEALLLHLLAARPFIVDSVRSTDALRHHRGASAIEVERIDIAADNASNVSGVLALDSATEALYAVAGSYGLSRAAADQVGVAWRAAGLDYSQMMGGVDTECDGTFDSAEVIEEKAKFACEQGMGGMMSWRLDNDNLQIDGKCVKGSEKRQGNAPSFKGARALFEAVQKYCKDLRAKGKFMVTGYIGTGINDDIDKDQWQARNGQPLYKVLPYDTVDRIYIAFANIKECEFQPLPEYMHDLVKVAREKNKNLEIYLTTSCGADQYQTSAGHWCHEPPSNEKFVQSLKSQLHEFDMDGIDVDWESGIEKEVLSSLLKQLHEAFQNTKYGVTMAVWPIFSESQYDLATIKQHVKHVSLMSYGGRMDSLSQSAKSFMLVPPSGIWRNADAE